MTPRSFLPQITGLFYATFHPHLGPIVQHQVPEDLITSRSEDARSRSASRTRERSPTLVTTIDFKPISEYIIPKKSLHGKLVNLLVTGLDDRDKQEYRIMGCPMVLTDEGGRYKRNEYMWNLCFVFEASSSLMAFEPVVRKCGRILRSAEIDSGYLSHPSTEHTPLPAVLEQLFEDLNSYSETSIPLDGFNSLELKLFPFYLYELMSANPAECNDWDVPVALVDLNTLKDDNWDITAARVSEYIDGINHVRRIAELADADPALTRETLRHMLYYQVIMMIDIFQYSNMYTVKPTITRLAADETVINECGAYVIKHGYTAPSWPALLRLYSRLLPGVTVHQWIEANEVLKLGIDPRRFVSFGIIKGFLRRVHRWPVRIDAGSPLLEPPPENRKRVGFDKNALQRSESALTRSGAGDSTFTLRSNESGLSPSSIPTRTPPSVTRSPRRPPPFTTSREGFPRSLASAETGPSHASRKSGKLGRIVQENTRIMAEEMEMYLDGTHHTDELQVEFKLGWGELEQILGQGKKGVVMVQR